MGSWENFKPTTVAGKQGSWDNGWPASRWHDAKTQGARHKREYTPWQRAGDTWKLAAKVWDETHKAGEERSEAIATVATSNAFAPLAPPEEPSETGLASDEKPELASTDDAPDMAPTLAQLPERPARNAKAKRERMRGLSKEAKKSRGSS